MCLLFDDLLINATVEAWLLIYEMDPIAHFIPDGHTACQWPLYYHGKESFVDDSETCHPTSLKARNAKCVFVDARLYDKEKNRDVCMSWKVQWGHNLTYDDKVRESLKSNVSYHDLDYRVTFKMLDHWP